CKRGPEPNPLTLTKIPIQLLLACILMSLLHPCAGHHLYQPQMWTFRNFLTGDIIGQDVTNMPAWTVRLRDIFTSDRSGEVSKDITVETYWCPSQNPGKKHCARPGYWFCGHWGCETILGTCTHLTITVLQPQDPSWAAGKLWSVFQRDSAPIIKDPDWGTVIQIIKAPTRRRHIIMGPNELATFVNTPSTTTPRKGEKPPGTVATPKPPHVMPMPKDQPQDQFSKILYAAFLSLNTTQPNLTESCWLCFDARLPFYEGVGSNRTFEYSSDPNPKQCKWDTTRKGITLGKISGQGTCIGNKDTKTQSEGSCSSVIRLDNQRMWAIPAAGNMWACHTTGLTPCVFIKHFNENNDLCVQVIVVPRILYHTDEEVTRHLLTEPRRARREVITAISLAMLLALGGTGAATGVTALATQGKGLQQLQKTIDEDLLRIHENIMKLEESLFSLSEVVLQNRRGLDLLLMQQGGLCAALNEECCTYVNHSGLIRKSMAELKNRIERRKLELEQRNWFNDLFGQYPWIAPVVSALVGPVVVVLLVLIFGPCLLNKITQFVKSRLSRIEVMVLQQKQLT
uniref:Envelope protein n=1 Tax=Cyanoderma ruficeps TaxID=181631 RepID=A0A8C3R0R8_9PASS